MITRGIRNNNPGNIRWGDHWQGLIPTNEKTDESFCQFVSAEYGIRALCLILLTYYQKYHLETIKDIIYRWAPPNENNTDAYVKAVANMVGVQEDGHINVDSYSVMAPLVKAIIFHENGSQPYDSATIDKGLSLAGVEK